MLKKIINFVLIFLLIINMLPATAYAATKMELNKTSKTLYINDNNKTETPNTYDFGVKNKPTNYKDKYSFKWYSDDPKIVEINQSGVVTALKVGTTKIYCDIITKSSGKLYHRLTATVTVKENAETVRIKNAPENNQLYVGQSFDFNREQKGASGHTSTDKVMWFVSNEEIGTIDSSGLFTAISPGEVEICVKTYQSAATLELGYTAESEPVTITVLAKEDDEEEEEEEPSTPEDEDEEEEEEGEEEEEEEPSTPEDEDEEEEEEDEEEPSTLEDEDSHKEESSQPNKETTSEEATESVVSIPLPQETFINNVMQQIITVKEGETSTIDGRELGIFSYSQSVIKNINNNRKATYILRYRYMGVEYETIIPANVEITIDEKIPWFGPLYILGGGLGPNVVTTIKS